MNPKVASRFRFGAHQYLWAPRWSDETLNLLDHIRALGVELFEVSLGDEIVFTPRRLRQRIQALGLELAIGPGAEWPMDCDLSDDDPENRARGLAWHRRMVDLAAESGALAYGGALYGHPGKVLRRRPPPDEFPRMAEGLHELAAYAARAGVTLAIEPMSRFRTHLVNTPEQAVRLVQLADHSNLRIALDTFHLVTEVRDYGAAVRTAGSLLWSVHACENDRGVPGGGLVPWDEIFDAMDAAPAPVRLLLETYATGLGDFGFARGVFQDLCPDGDTFAREGIAFLRRLAAAHA